MAVSRMTEHVGRVLDRRYRVVRPLGRGASAQVFLAEDVRLRRRVAVKMLHEALADDADFLRRFRAEAQSAAALTHSNVLVVFDWSQDEDGVPYLVLEYLAGGSLRAMLDHHTRLTVAQAARIGIEATRGLQYAHGRGFVHRDIKPANLLFGEEGRLRIADFGLARALAEAALTEPQGAVLGTARYASPEQAQGQTLTGKADVYSLALVLIEAVTGAVPFVADTTLGTLMARVGRDVDVPEALGALREVLARATRAEPAERIDAEALLAGLLAAAGTLPDPEPLPLAGAHADAGLGDDPDPTMMSAAATGPVVDLTELERSERAVTPDDRAVAEAARDDLEVPDFVAALRARWADADDDDELVVLDDRGPGEAGVDSSDATVALAGAGEDADPTGDGDGDGDGAATGRRARRRARRAAAAAAAAAGSAAAVGAMAGSGAASVAAPAVGPEAPGRSVAPAGDGRSGRDGDGGDDAPRRRRWPFVAGILAILAVAGAGVAIAAATRGREKAPPAPPPTHLVPRLIGLAEDAARGNLVELRFTVARTTIRKDGTRAGEVVAIRPEPGTRLAEGRTVTLVVSQGQDIHDLPQQGIAGQPAEQVQRLLEAIGFSVASTTEFSEEVPKGALIAYADGTPARLEAGSQVALRVSDGPAPRAIPSGLVGAPEARAVEALHAVQLKAGVTTAFSDTVPAGTVIDVSPRTGTVPRGTVVQVVVSKGPELIRVPSIKGATTLEQAVARLVAAGLRPGQVRGPATGKPKTYSPTGGAMVRKGTAVDIVLG
ncbi:MAG: protein kinase [Actinobacteria bacterium]|nr:protein kinase [Actinomycetota bacterium]